MRTLKILVGAALLASPFVAIAIFTLKISLGCFLFTFGLVAAVGLVVGTGAILVNSATSDRRDNP